MPSNTKTDGKLRRLDIACRSSEWRSLLDPIKHVNLASLAALLQRLRRSETTVLYDQDFQSASRKDELFQLLPEVVKLADAADQLIVCVCTAEAKHSPRRRLSSVSIQLGDCLSDLDFIREAKDKCRNCRRQLAHRAGCQPGRE